MSVHEFALLRKIDKLLNTEGQWLVKTPDHAPTFNRLGRYSRWRRNRGRFGSHAELLEANLDLLEFAKRTGLIR